MDKRTVYEISTREHMNIILNIYQCGNACLEGKQIWGPEVPDYYLMACVNSGSGVFTSDVDVYSISEGKCFFGFPMKKISFYANEGEKMDVTWVAFSGYLIQEYLSRAKVTSLSPIFLDDEVKTLTKNINAMFEKSSQLPNRYCKIASLLYDAFYDVIDIATARNTTKQKTPYFYVTKALDYIDIHFAEDISVEMIAQHVGVSRKKLLDIFKKNLNTTLRSYLIKFRIDKAKVLLLDKTLTIDEISQIVGYTMQYYFSTEFKRLVGMTPTEYRNKNT